jgi:hypothetical protein
MGECGSCSGSDDGRERIGFRALVAKIPLQQTGNLQLGHARVHHSQRGRECGRCHRRSPADVVYLFRVLPLTQRFDEVSRRAPLPLRSVFAQSLKVAM